MAISTTLDRFLRDRIGQYDTIEHPYTEHTIDSAHMAHISPRQVAKGVLLHDYDHYLMAVIPSMNKVLLDRIEQLTGRRLELAHEGDLPQVLSDCQKGAVPAVGQAFGLNVIWDDALQENDDLYMESGDHRLLIHLTHDQFMRLMEHNDHGEISWMAEELPDMKNV